MILERGMERERERKVDVRETTGCYAWAPTRDRTCNLDMYSNQELNPRLTTERHEAGLSCPFDIDISLLLASASGFLIMGSRDMQTHPRPISGTLGRHQVAI